MSTLENTYSTTITIATSGSTGLQYFPLSNPVQASGAAFVIKNMIISSDVQIGGTGGVNTQYAVFASTDAIGTQKYILKCVPNSVVPPTQVINVFGDGTNIAVRTSYLALNMDLFTPGTIKVVIVYSMIPASNVLSNTIGYLEQNTPAINYFNCMQSSLTNTRVLQTSNVTNLYGDDTYTIQYFYRFNGGVLDCPITNQITLLPYETYTFQQPAYLQPSSNVNTFAVRITPQAAGLGVLNYCSFVDYV